MFYVVNENRRLELYKPGPLVQRVGAVYDPAAIHAAQPHESLEQREPHPEFSRQKKMAKAYEEQLEDSAHSHPLMVEAIMSRPAITFFESTPIKEAIATMQSKGFKNFPVVSNDGHLIGIVSDRDLLLNAKTRVGDLMSKHVVGVNPKAPLRQLVAILLQEKLSCAPVVEADQSVVGIVTITDILKSILTHPAIEVWR